MAHLWQLRGCLRRDINGRPNYQLKSFVIFPGKHADKDARDIFTIIRYYGEPVSQDRLFEEEFEIMEREEHNIEYAGAHLLGKDVGGVSGVELGSKLIEILDGEISDSGNQRLAIAMMAYSIEEDFDNKVTLLEKVRTGLAALY
jgi:predicted nucleotidyltransferase